jgi:hypothetical protein
VDGIGIGIGIQSAGPAGPQTHRCTSERVLVLSW